MSYQSLRSLVVGRLDEGGGGDRGWWLITRVHLTTARLRDTARYLNDAGAAFKLSLTAADYAAIAKVVDVGGTDPGVQLRRHLLLAMQSPLRLIDREDGSWKSVQLTSQGVDLATSGDAATVLERSLHDIQFCASPWFTEQRVEAFSDFQINPYSAILRVMSGCGGWIDRDEYDLFVSRVRNEAEIELARDAILDFRRISVNEQDQLLREVRDRLPNSKVYQNWRDMGLHHFSLFNLGTSAVRSGKKLLLSSTFVAGIDQWAETSAEGEFSSAASSSVKPTKKPGSLKVPEPMATEELSVPPTTPATNAGTDAEVLVGKLLQAAGWTVVYYSSKRGYGFDLWARKLGAAIVVEVKSSLNVLGSVSLTRLEYEAAAHHRANFVLALVEHLDSNSPRVYFIANPIETLVIVPRPIDAFVIGRESWESVAKDLGG